MGSIRLSSVGSIDTSPGLSYHGIYASVTSDHYDTIFTVHDYKKCHRPFGFRNFSEGVDQKQVA
jgi:hypothetical protein